MTCTKEFEGRTPRTTYRLTATGIYELPFGRGRKLMGKPDGLGGNLIDGVIGGWQVQGIVSLMSGTWFSPTAPDALLNAPGNQQRPNVRWHSCCRAIRRHVHHEHTHSQQPCRPQENVPYQPHIALATLGLDRATRQRLIDVLQDRPEGFVQDGKLICVGAIG